MKKRFALSLMIAGMFTSSVFAAGNTGTINFIGVLTDTTCNFSLANANGAHINAVDLGTHTATTFTNSTEVSFSLIPDQNVASCKTPGAKKVSFEVVPSGLNSAGVNNTGTATNAAIKLEVQGQSGFTEISSATPKEADVKVDATTGAIPLKASMVSIGTATPGTVAGGAVFAVTYQ
ncbi:hypothetical protein GJV07_22875 [Enterobacteriaceae bacterium RIT711]|nr:hypothetical protein [Enterobacteriaceae bacterium RIT711]